MRRVADDLEDHRHHDRIGCIAVARKTRLERRARGDLLVGGVDPERSPQKVRDERVRRGLFVRRATRGDAVHRGRQRAAELGDEARLAHTRLADDRHDLSPAGLGLAQDRAESRELGHPADERRRVGLDRHVQHADDAVRDDRLALPLERDRLALLELEPVHREPSRRLAHQDLAQGRRRLEALRGVHRVTDDRVRALHVVGEQPGDHLAGVHADAQRQADAVLAIEVVVEAHDRGLHRERGMDRALGVVLVRDRRAEDGHDGVPDVLVDRALVSLDLPCQGAEVRAEDAAQLFGVELLRERRGAREIREQDRDGPMPQSRVNRTLALDGAPADRLPIHAPRSTPQLGQNRSFARIVEPQFAQVAFVRAGRSGMRLKGTSERNGLR